MKKLYLLVTILCSFFIFGQTPISLIGANIPYNEDFSGMGETSTDYLPGWTAINSINGQTLAMQVSNGSSNSANVFNVGTTASEDRAFASLADATVVPSIGAVFTNNTGGLVTKISIQARMEQWKESSNASVNETVAFSYSLNATSLSTGTWTAVTTLDLKEKLTSATTNNAVNGNLASNYSLLSTIISGINWTAGTNLWIKWTDVNDAGNNGMYAVDNFSISISEALSTKQNSISGLNMYPNPVANGTLYITSDSSEAKYVSVYDLLGKQVLNTTSSNNTVDVSPLRGGSYIIKITEDGKTDTRKLIIK